MLLRMKFIVVIPRCNHWIKFNNNRNILYISKYSIKYYHNHNHKKYFSSSLTIDNDNVSINMKDDINYNDDDKNGHSDVFDSHQVDNKNDDDDDDDDYTRQYIDIIPTESHSLTIDDMLSYNFHTIISDENNINNYDNNAIAGSSSSSSDKRTSVNKHINNDDNNNDNNNNNNNDDDMSKSTSNNSSNNDNNDKTTNNNVIRNNNNNNNSNYKNNNTNNNIIIDDNASTNDFNSIEDSIGVFRESEIDDIRVLVNNYTAPALAEALRDRETTLQSAAMLFFNNDMISLKHLLSPFSKVWYRRVRYQCIHKMISITS